MRGLGVAYVDLFGCIAIVSIGNVATHPNSRFTGESSKINFGSTSNNDKFLIVYLRIDYLLEHLFNNVNN